jgi:DNA-binding MarR family transcriptional regulator
MSIESEIQSKGFLLDQEKTFVNVILSGALFYTQINIFFKRYNLTEPQYNVLRILRGSYPKKMLTSDLQSRLLHKSSNATRLLKKIIDKGLIISVQCKEDKRQYFHSLTPKGLTLLATIDPHLKKYCIEQITLSPSKLEQLNSLLDELRNGIPQN